jgi:hypothetical protein
MMMVLWVKALEFMGKFETSWHHVANLRLKTVHDTWLGRQVSSILHVNTGPKKLWHAIGFVHFGVQCGGGVRMVGGWDVGVWHVVLPIFLQNTCRILMHFEGFTNAYHTKWYFQLYPRISSQDFSSCIYMLKPPLYLFMALWHYGHIYIYIHIVYIIMIKWVKHQPIHCGICIYIHTVYVYIPSKTYPILQMQYFSYIMSTY